jgi:hypothetical protein
MDDTQQRPCSVCGADIFKCDGRFVETQDGFRLCSKCFGGDGFAAAAQARASALHASAEELLRRIGEISKPSRDDWAAVVEWPSAWAELTLAKRKAALVAKVFEMIVSEIDGVSTMTVTLRDGLSIVATPSGVKTTKPDDALPF